MAKAPKVVQTIRKLRHWKQQFQKNARFVWRKDTRWPNDDGPGDTLYPGGSFVPVWIQQSMGAKLRRFWESQRIELYEVQPGARDEAAAEVAAEEQAAAPREPAKKKKTTRKKATTRAAAPDGDGD